MLSRMNFLFFITGPYQMGEIFAENSLHSPARSEWSEFGLQTESYGERGCRLYDKLCNNTQ